MSDSDYAPSPDPDDPDPMDEDEDPIAEPETILRDGGVDGAVIKAERLDEDEDETSLTTTVLIKSEPHDGEDAPMSPEPVSPPPSTPQTTQEKIVILSANGYKQMTQEVIQHKKASDVPIGDARCRMCQFSAKNPEEVLFHMETVHKIMSEKRFSCSECHFKSDHRMPYLIHYERDHMKTKQYLCPVCDFNSPDFAIRNRHLEINHTLCTGCDFSGTSQLMLTEHISNEHSKKSYKCDHCEYESLTQNGIDNHVTIEHVKLSQERSRNCRLCSYKTNVALDLFEHMFRDHNLSEVKCDDCSFTASNSWELNDHAETHEVKGFQCDQCEYTTNRIMFLNRHKKARHSEKSFHCPYCSFKSAQRWCVKQHIVQVHEKSRLYPCEYCDYKASSRGNLNVHIRGVHERDKRYECTQCDFKTCHKSGLLKHLRSHRGKELICEMCDFRTSSKGTMFVHKKDAHGVPCTHCDYVATSESALATHLRIKHNEASVELSI